MIDCVQHLPGRLDGGCQARLITQRETEGIIQFRKKINKAEMENNKRNK